MTARTSSALEREIAEQSHVLQVVLGNQRDVLDDARTAVARAQRTLLAGIGSSRHVAAFGAACLDRVTTSVLLAAPGHGIALPAFGSDDVVLIASQSGLTPALMPLARAARSAGSTVISVTNTDTSPLEQEADIALRTGGGPEVVVPATKSVSASMLLLRAVARPVEPAAVVRLGELVADLVDDPSGQVATAVRHHAPPAVVVSGGFAAEAVSDEVALKLAEVTARLSVAETVVDYLHGPAAVPAPLLAFLDPDDPNAAAVAGRPQTLLVGPDPSCDVVLPLSGDSALDAIARVVAGQCLALRWAEHLGLDPDDPRGLDKVTDTR